MSLTFTFIYKYVKAESYYLATDQIEWILTPPSHCHFIIFFPLSSKPLLGAKTLILHIITPESRLPYYFCDMRNKVFYMLPPINVMYVERLFNTSQSVKTNYLRMIYKYSNNKLNCVRIFGSDRSPRSQDVVCLFVRACVIFLK